MSGSKRCRKLTTQAIFSGAQRASHRLVRLSEKLQGHTAHSCSSAKPKEEEREEGRKEVRKEGGKEGRAGCCGCPSAAPAPPQRPLAATAAARPSAPARYREQPSTTARQGAEPPAHLNNPAAHLHGAGMAGPGIGRLRGSPCCRPLCPRRGRGQQGGEGTRGLFA